MLVNKILSMLFVGIFFIAPKQSFSKDLEVILAGLTENDYDVLIAKKAIENAGYVVKFKRVSVG